MFTAAGCALRKHNPAVTPQVDSSFNMLKEKSLKEFAEVLGLTIAQVTPQVVAVKVCVHVTVCKRLTWPTFPIGRVNLDEFY